ncbi:MAG: acetylglutamate kinase [Actinomycetota bacterium]
MEKGIKYFNSITDSYSTKVGLLLESLPYIKEYFNRIVVVKVGGAMMEDESRLKSVLEDLVLMKYVGIKVVLVHGGGKQITRLMEERGIKPKFVDGLRVTDEKVMEIVKMVLVGEINSKVVSFLNRHGRIALGISGNDASFITCKKKKHKKGGREVDLGYVGQIVDIDSSFVSGILDKGFMPVIATLGVDASGNVYNINADTCASEIAVALGAEKLISLTDVDGIIKVVDGKRKLVSAITKKMCMEMISTGEIDKGMIPKVAACIDALAGGVGRTHILNGNKQHSVLAEIFTDKGIGTMIVKEDF